jgi:lipopolysaccharide export system protein LptA
MNQQHASRFQLNQARHSAVAIATAVLLGVGPLVAQQPVATFSNSPTNSPSDGGVKEPTVITSERLDVDYAKNVFTFTGNVLAVDPQMTLHSDKMVAFLGATTNASATATNAAVASTNAPAPSGAAATPTVQKIIATGSVLITQDKKRATCGRAEYTADDGRVVLTENPKVEQPDGTVTGEKITFWRGQDKMEVESGTRSGTRLVLVPEDKKPPAPDQTSAPKNQSNNTPPTIPSTP